LILAVGSTIAQRACNDLRHIQCNAEVINKLPRQLTLLMSTWPLVLSTYLDYHQRTLLMTSRIPSPVHRRSTDCWFCITDRLSEPSISVADEHKFLAVRCLSRRLLDRSKYAVIAYPTCIWRCRWGWSCRNFVEIFGAIKLESWAIVRRCLSDPILLAVFVELQLVTVRHRQTDRLCPSVCLTVTSPTDTQ